jgi:hypothetical protein
VDLFVADPIQRAPHMPVERRADWPMMARRLVLLR